MTLRTPPVYYFLFGIQVDASDPDADLPNRIHMLQTAEGLRKAGHPDWMQVV